MSVSICIIEHWFRCWRQEETQRISCIKSVTPAPLSMTWTTKTFPFSPILTLQRWKGNRFLLLYSHVCDNQKSLIGQTSFDRKLVRGKKGVLYYGTHDKSQWDKHDRKWCMHFEYTKIVKPIFLKDSSNENIRFSNKNFEISA